MLDINKIDVENLQIFELDQFIGEYKTFIQNRFETFKQKLNQIIQQEGSLQDFAKGYLKYGFTITSTHLVYKEYAPGAKEVYLFGEFNNWNRTQHPLTRDNFGNFEIKLSFNEKNDSPIQHNTRIKAHVVTQSNQQVDRIPVWCKRLYQNDENKIFDGLYWNPEQKYQFKYPKPPKTHALRIYQVHIGICGKEPSIHTFTEFTKNVLPRIKNLGYNCILLMALSEHAYYGSFGYHVTNLFAISNRFGTPEELKLLIDEAHRLGISVLMNIVHSHASKNVNDGFNQWDGTDYLYFKGNHELWDSKLYNYYDYEVLRLLLSNLSWFMNEYNVDGFRFDGVASMLYLHHGINVNFTGSYPEYFNEQADIDSIIYLMLANYLIHQIYPDAITIAEDVSGYPTLSRKIEEGGIGFDYRLFMAVPDLLILLKQKKDEDWVMQDIIHTLTNRRKDENCIIYCESHDQSLIGYMTLSTLLFEQDIYENMSVFVDETPLTNRGMSLHKMIRLITIGIGGEGYLNFMGNEFGHPDYIDFPREENGFSYNLCRRRWDLVDDKLMRFRYLNEFDKGMMYTEEFFNWLSNKYNYVSTKHEEDKIIAFERNNLLFVFNFHPTISYDNYRIGTNIEEDHLIVLDTDEKKYGGHNRVKTGHYVPIKLIKESHNNRPFSLNLYIPSRIGIVLTSQSKGRQFQKWHKENVEKYYNFQ